MKKVLVTGFGAFPGAPFNPTVAILKRLERDWRRALALAGLDLHTQVCRWPMRARSSESPR